MLNKNFFNKSTQVNLYNVSSSFNFVQKALLLYHAVDSAINKTKVHWAIIGVVFATILQDLFALPYKWDKYSMRRNSLVSIFLSSITLVFYLSDNFLEYLI